MKLVREIRIFGHIRVANAIYAEGYEWRNPKYRPRNIDVMLEGLPRITLVRVLNRLKVAHDPARWK